MENQLELYHLFLQPPAVYRGKPFWSWNGTLEKEELFRQIHVLHEMGFGGFFMHSRTGLATEYLGDDWFELINACAEEAEKLGMEAWLYDEDRWPSGTAGGMVTQEPRFRLKFIRLQIIPADQFMWADNFIAAFACRLEGLSYYNMKPLVRDMEEALEEGLSVLAFSIVEQEKGSFYNGYTYTDTLNREATDRFIELTHDKYKSRSGKHLGKTIKGIFTDEPHRGALMDGFSLTNEDCERHAPWSYALFDRFQEVYGYDLLLKLPDLFLQSEGRPISQVKWHYVDLLQEMFQDNFAKPIQEWCKANDLILTGHILHEDSLSAQTAMVGSVMRYYAYMDYPGVDVLTEGNANYWIVKQLSSAARQLGKKWLMSELYGCTGWQMPLEGHKSVGDWQALFGINLRCHHLSWYTMEGESKRDYPASISHQSAWWRDYNYVETYFSRLGVILSQGKPLCDLLVINPVESLWCQIYPGWSKHLGAQSPSVLELEQVYRDTFHWLSGEQIDFDYADEEMLGRLGSVEIGADGKAVLHVGQAAYRSVLIVGMTTIRSSTVRLLERFKVVGGSVIFAGAPPLFVDALVSDAARELASKAVHVPFIRSVLAATCRESIRGGLVLRAIESATAPESIYAQMRAEGETIYLVLMNMDRESWQRNIQVSIEGNGYVEEWFCASGERRHVAISGTSGKLEFIADFPPSGEHVYVVHSGRKDESLTRVVRYLAEAEQEIAGPYAYRLEEPNVCVLDWAAHRIDGGEWQAPMEILQVDRAIRRSLELPYRCGDMIQPWFTQKFNPYTLEGKTAVELSFDFIIDEMPTGPMHLAMEKPEGFEIRMNGFLLAASRTDGWWVDRCFVKVLIPSSCCRLGSNTIELSVQFHQGIDLEALYLLGDFGVRIDKSRKIIMSLPAMLSVGSITEQGLPFYGGTVAYMLAAEKLVEANRHLTPLRPDRSEKTMLALSGFAAACVKVRSADLQEQIIAWQPYEAEIVDIADMQEHDTIRLDVVLTRRNTFGPLHQLPLHAPAYGPENWLTSGENFSEDYILLPSGLLSAPKLVKQVEL